MGDQSAPRFGSKQEYARHRGVSHQYIGKLAKSGVLVMRGKKVDFRASDMVLDDKPVDDVEPPPVVPARIAQMPSRPPADPPAQPGATFGEARRIEMVFRAKLRRLEFETKQGRLIEAEAVRRRIAEHVRALRDGLLGLPDRISSSIAAETGMEHRKVHVLLTTEISRELDALATAIGGI